MKVLVTDGSYNQTLGIVRTLGKRGYEVSVIDNKPFSSSSLSRYCKKQFVGPNPKDANGFSKFLLSIIKDFDILIPVGSNSVRAVAMHQKELKKFTSIELPTSEKVLTALNKKATYKIAKEIGILIPRTFFPSNLEEVNNISEKLPYPVVIKALEDTGVHIVEYIATSRELIPKYREICAKYELKVPNLPMIQQQVYGDGYGFFALYQNGKLKKLFMHHRIREYPVTGGVSSCAESFWSPKLKEYGKRILDELKWHGPCMVEFKGPKLSMPIFCGSKEVKDFTLMEINPKFWGSLDLALASGVDFPYWLCEMAKGEKLKYSENYKIGIKYHWPLSDDFLHIVKKPASLPDFIKDSLTARSNILWSDLKPNLWEFKNTVLKVIRDFIGNLRCLFFVGSGSLIRRGRGEN